MKPNLWMYSSPKEMQRTSASLILFGANVLMGAKIIKEINYLKKISNELDSRAINPIAP